ncbi:MurR/RpiR family transcriptional regulator [Salinibacterium sp. GXW1014]|uniref:MurR/RpiR family transcriptional regulator n=1 Tax=Salinibacterium sp. GXW1014 TaxID=3377838 RepID=UPI00383A05FC
MFTPELGSTVAVMRASLPKLNPSERLVVEQMIADPGGIPELAASDLAARCGTSAATVIRACQAMGFKGFQHVRTLLVRDAGAAAAAGESLVLEQAGIAGRAARQLRETASLLEGAAKAMDAGIIERAVSLLSEARRIVLIGSGSSAATVQALSLRSAFSGIAVEAPSDPVVQALTCRLLDANDVCLAVSDSGMTPATVTAAEAAKKSGASVIAVTGYARSRLAQLGDVTVTAGVAGASWQHSVLASNMVQMVILNAMQLEVASRRSVLERSTALASEEIFESVLPEPEGESPLG